VYPKLSPETTTSITRKHLAMHFKLFVFSFALVAFTGFVLTAPTLETGSEFNSIFFYEHVLMTTDGCEDAEIEAEPSGTKGTRCF
jgi:hypothetical protein